MVDCYKKPNVLAISYLLNNEEEELMKRNQLKSLRQHQLESKKIEQDLFIYKRKDSLDSISSSIYSYFNTEKEDAKEVKLKRTRASKKQIEVLNKVFQRTFFPSTQLRNELGRQLGMSPRTVQIWFQNKRQSLKIKYKEESSSQSSNSRQSSISN